MRKTQETPYHLSAIRNESKLKRDEVREVKLNRMTELREAVGRQQAQCFVTC